MLKHLIAEAVALGGGNLCAVGHDWESEGGRTCPKYEDAGCSQTVYVCRRCGANDYGNKGGPAHRECFTECRRDFADEIAEDAEYAKEVARLTAEAPSNVGVVRRAADAAQRPFAAACP
jgi:hypothetical protein